MAHCMPKSAGDSSLNCSQCLKAFRRTWDGVIGSIIALTAFISWPQITSISFVAIFAAWVCAIFIWTIFFCQTTKSSKSPTIAPSWIKLYCGYLTKFHKFMKGWLRFRRISLHHNAFILMKKLEIACKTEFFLQHGMLNLSIHHFISVKCQLLHFLQELIWYSITLSANGKAGVPKYDRYLNTNCPKIDRFVEL